MARTRPMPNMSRPGPGSATIKNTRKESGFWGIFRVDLEWQDSSVGRIISQIQWAVSGVALGSFLASMADPYMQDQIIGRFAIEGDKDSGPWDPLAPTTERIRDNLGFPPDHPINERTGELLRFVLYNRDFSSGSDWASMDIPGDPDSAQLEAKLRHAQMGAEDNVLFPGSYTPPRPVLAVGPDDMEILLKMLELHVMHRAVAGLS
jgi:hypothetical protein